MAKNRKDLMTRVSRIVADVAPPEPVGYLDENLVIKFSVNKEAENTLAKENKKDHDRIMELFAAGYACPRTTPYWLEIITATLKEPDWKELYRAQWEKTYLKKYHSRAVAVSMADKKMKQIKENTPPKFQARLERSQNATYRAPEPVVEEVEVA